MPPSDPIVNARFDPLTLKAIDAIADSENETRSEILRQLVDTALILYHSDTKAEDVLEPGLVEDKPFREAAKKKPPIFD